ncbi:MAG: sigma-70 family RNA polymerase sigma factor [Bacteroidota bacterium]
MTDVSSFDYHGLLFPIAYNMLRDAADAEDLVQETMLKWLSVDTPNVQNVKAYLVKTLVNKCLNFIRDQKRARTHQESLALPVEKLNMPQWIEHGPALSLSMLAMLEKLSSIERAVFLLKEVFGYSHREIAEILEISEENCRQILSRAKRHLRQDKVRFIAEPERHRRLYETFVEVCQGEDLGQLLEILKEDINLDLSRPAAVVGGKLQVAEHLLRWRREGYSFHRRVLGGRYAIVLSQEERPIHKITIEGDENGISYIRIFPLTNRKNITFALNQIQHT